MVTLVQTASAESYQDAGTQFLLVVAAITVRVPLTAGYTWDPHEFMFPSILTQLLLIGIIDMEVQLSKRQSVDGVGETVVGSAVANAPAKLKPITAIAVKIIAAMVVFIFIISSF